MEIGRHAEEFEHGHSSIQLLQMPWSNISSRPTSRQQSQDPQSRPQSRDSMHSGGGVFLSSVSHGFLDDTDIRYDTPINRRSKSIQHTRMANSSSFHL
jgi:hypothetical protein